MSLPLPFTAIGAALFRAAHLTEDGEPSIFADPLARPLVGAELADQFTQSLRKSWPPTVLPIARSIVTTRARLCEDRLRAWRADGGAQYLVLGAGLDTFGQRCPEALADLRVFEVDHPVAQAWKRERLRASGLGEPPGVHYVPVDFEHESLEQGLLHAGFRFDTPVYVAWLGVSQYLTLPAIAAMLSLLGSFAPGSTAILTYIVPEELRDDADRAFADAAMPLTAARGEPWLSCFHPDEFAALAQHCGFDSVEHFGPAEAAAQPYFYGRTDELRPHGLERCIITYRLKQSA